MDAGFRRGRMKHDTAVSQVVGAIILVAIAVIAMGIVVLVLVSGSLPTTSPPSPASSRIPARPSTSPTREETPSG
jgi:FlaG/FlaF family flagellin (archaellin)